MTGFWQDFDLNKCPAGLKKGPAGLKKDPGVLLKGPGVLLKDPGVLLKDPGVLLKDPGVLLKGPRVLLKYAGVLLKDPGIQIERGNPGFSWSGRPRAAGKPLKKVGGEAPHLFVGFPGRPADPENPGFPLSIWPPLLVPPPM